MTDCFFRTAVS